MSGPRSTMSEPDPVAPGPAYATLAHKIRDQIVSGDLRPGDRLPTEVEMSTQFEVSRNTAREAMRVLASQGLVDTRRGATGGNFIAHPSPDAIRDSLHTGLDLLAASKAISLAELMEVREILEVPAAERAALRRTEEDLDHLRESLAVPNRPTRDVVFVAHRDFHTALVRAAHNPLFAVVAEPMLRVPLRERFVRHRDRTEYWSQVEVDHHAILDCVAAGDPIGAREASSAHLRYLRSSYTDSGASD